MVKLFNGVPCRLVHDLQQRLLLLQHLSPLDLDLNGLALACGRHSGLLQHGCTDPQPSSVNTTRPQAPSQESIKSYNLGSSAGGAHLLRVAA